MAAYPVVVVGDDGVVEIPIELQADPRFQKGAKLELVPIPVGELSPETPKGDWRRLEGILAGTKEKFSATEWKREEREWELAHDERKFGTKRPSW